MKRYLLGLLCAAFLVAGAAAWPGAASAATKPAVHTDPLVTTLPAAGVRPALGARPYHGTTVTSSNWAGYDDSTDGPFTTVTGTWTQPRVRTTGATFTDAAFWVGLDGDNSDTVEQIGTEGYSQGVAGYDAWYEMYPLYPVAIDMPIHAGDVLTGTVTFAAPAAFTLTLVNHTTGDSFTTGQVMSIPPQLASAEAIAEAPTNDSTGDLIPATDFGIVRFNGCSFNDQPVAAYDWNQIDMTSEYSSALVAQASALGTDGGSFWVTTDVTPPTTTVSGAGSRWHDKAVTLRFRATDGSGGQGVAYTEYSLDRGATWTHGATATVLAPADHSNDGLNTVLYRSADKAGNVERRHTCHVLIDTRRPTPIAKWADAAVRGARTALHFYVRDPRPGSPTATVTIRIHNAHGVLARKAVLAGVTVDRTLSYGFTCWLPKGAYRFSVATTDAAGNAATVVAANTLVVR
jgi:Peptidase A4 family